MFRSRFLTFVGFVSMVMELLPLVQCAVAASTSVAPASGEVAVTAGALSPVQKWKAEEVLRGVGAPVSKSATLLSVSVQPAFLRIAAVVLLSVGVAVVSAQLAPS